VADGNNIKIDHKNTIDPSWLIGFTGLALGTDRGQSI
jgi:hypothetical protein